MTGGATASPRSARRRSGTSMPCWPSRTQEMPGGPGWSAPRPAAGWRSMPRCWGGSGVDAWHRLEEIRVPVTVACGQLDAHFLIPRSRELAGRLPGGRYRELPGMAHQPYLEQPGQVADLVLAALAAAEHRA